jgi:hypothetical protein
MIASELLVGYSILDRYMARRVPKSKSPELFDSEGNARWITIGAEASADGKKHGGHPVKISGDGKMLTGKFAGKTMSEAFGKGNKLENGDDVDLTGYPPINPGWKGTKTEFKAHIDKLRGMAKDYDAKKLGAGITDVTPPGYGPGDSETKQPEDKLPPGWTESKPGGMATDKSGNIIDQEIKSGKWFVIHDGPTLEGFDTREAAFEALKNYKPDVKPKDSLDLKPEPKQPEQPPGDGIPRVTQDQIGDGSNGTYDQMHAGLASEFVQSRIAKGMEGIENREYAIFQHPSGKWQMVSRKKKADNLVDKPAEKPAEQPKPASQPEDSSNPEPDSAASAFGKTISSGGTPREAAKAAQKKLDEDYEFARSSTVKNAGEDLKDSARHKRNQWRGLEQAEKDGTAAELITRDSLLKNEPPDFMSHADKNPLTSLAMHFAMRAFPAKPGKNDEKNRREFLGAYQRIKQKANELAESHSDGRALDAVKTLQDHVLNEIYSLRGQKSRDSIGTATAPDRYNQTANDLVNLHKALTQGWRARKTGVVGKLNEFASAVQEKYGKSITDISGSGSRDEKESILSSAAEHAKDIMEGSSFNKTFGKESKATNRFNPAELYVKIATRQGGRNLSKITSNPNSATKHLVDNFGIRGVQWGNSVTDDERKHHAARAVEALTDLADTLGIHPKDIAIDGKLGLAIGARGQGGAVAHYEPSSNVINLTRVNGVGSLAHEWGHAFDHYLNGFNASKFMTQDINTHEMTYGEEKVSKMGPAYKGWKSTTSDPERMEKAGYKVTARSDAPLRKAFSELKTAQSDYRSRLNAVLKDAVKGGFMGEDKAEKYWNSEVEIFARTFERYVQHKIESTGNKNTYLVGIETKAHKFGGLWPTDAEVQAMAPAFDAIFEAYRQQKYGSPEKVKFSRSAAMQELMAAWGLTSNIEHYGRKSPKSSPGQMSFDDHDGGKWITIGSEQGSDGGKHGGHPVYIGKDGEMKTGKFAGKTLGEAFGKSKSPEQTTGPESKSPEQSLETSEPSGSPSSLAIDPDQLRGNNFKFADEPVVREINNRRLAASKRRLKLERDAVPLISDQIAELQPTPEQRIKDKDKSAQDRFKHFDEQAKATRVKAIKGISELSPEDQQRFMAYWNNSPIPSDPAYLATALAKFKSGKVNTQAIVDRSSIEDPEKRKRVEKLDKQKMTMQNIFDNATAVEGKRYAKERIDQIQNELEKELALTGGEVESSEATVSQGNATDTREQAIQHALGIIDKTGHVQTGAQAEQQGYTAWANMPEKFRKQFSGYKEFGSAVGKAFHERAKTLLGNNSDSKQPNDRPPESDMIEATQKDAEQLSKQIGKNVHVARVKQTGEIVAISNEQTSDPRVEVISSHGKPSSPSDSLQQLDADRKLKQGRFHALQEELQPMNERALLLERAVSEARENKVGKHDEDWNAANRDYQKLNKQLQTLNAKRKPLLDSWSRLQDEANEAHRAYNKQLEAIKSADSENLAPPSPGITFDTRSNDSAKANDQMGLFGDVANVPRGPATLPPGGESKGKQLSMFDTQGDPDQMLMFDDGVTPEDRVMKFGRSSATRDRAAELVRYWELSAERLVELKEVERYGSDHWKDQPRQPKGKSDKGKKIGGRFAPQTTESFEEIADQRIKIVLGLENAPKSKKEATDWWKKNGVSSAIGPSGLKVSTPMGLISKITSGNKGFARVRMAIVPSIQDLLANGVGFSRPDYRNEPDMDFVSEIYSAFEHDTQIYRVRWIVKHFKEDSQKGTKLHSARVEDIVIEPKNEKSSGTRTRDAEAAPHVHSPSTITIRKLFNGINPFFSENERYSSKLQNKKTRLVSWKPLMQPIQQASVSKEGTSQMPTVQETGLTSTVDMPSAISIDKEISKVKPTDKKRYSAPSEAQREAGNYPKKHIRLHGLDISIETAKGDRRRSEWPPMPCDYGYIRGTVGKDKDHVDVFIGPNKQSELVVVVDQVDQSGKFDEHKVLLGFSNEDSAISQYKKAYTSGWKVGPVTVMTIGQFKSWLKDGSQNKPLERQVSKFSSRSSMVPA